MKPGTLVKNKLCRDENAKIIGVVIEVIDDLYIEDEECQKWRYQPFLKVLLSTGEIEINPQPIYEVVSDFNCKEA